MKNSNEYKSFFRKRILYLFLPIFIIGILSEPYIMNNPFSTLEDYGEFIFFLMLYFIVLFGLSAFILSVTWRVKNAPK